MYVLHNRTRTINPPSFMYVHSHKKDSLETNGWERRFCRERCVLAKLEPSPI